VPELPDAPPWPELAADLTLGGKPTTVDECAQMRFYRGKVLHFWRTEPEEKAKLSVQAVWMLWRRSPGTEGTDSPGGISGLARTVFEPAYILAIYALALVGLTRLRRRYLALTLLLLGYGTLMAMVFAGTMRYSAPWNFLLCIPAAAALVELPSLVAARRRDRSAEA